MESFTLGPLAFSTRLMLLVGVAIAVFMLASRLGRKAGIEVEKPLWIILLAGLLAGRIPFVAVYRDMYLAAPWSIFDLRDGGFNAVTGVAGALVTAFILTRYVPRLRKPLFVSLAAGAFLWGAGTAILDIDTRAQGLPRVALSTLDGRTVQLEALGGKPMVINLWATWCPPCRREMPVLRDAQSANPDIVFVFANQAESAAIVKRYLDEEKMVLENVLLDPQGALAREVGSVATPTTLFFNKQGRHVDTRVGEVSAATLAQRLRSLRE